MKTLKLYAATHNLSILVTANARARRRASSPPYKGGVAAAAADGGVLSSSSSSSSNPHSAIRTPHFAARPIELDDIAAGPALADLADSAFAIARSTFGDEYRYVKHLKSKNSPSLGFGHGTLDSGPDVLTYRLERMENGKLKTENSTENYPLSVVHCPFLGFTYLGPSSETDHLRDYAAEALNPQSAIRNPKLKSSRSTLIDGILSGEYQKYLER
jgi:hypothetical protein